MALAEMKEQCRRDHSVWLGETSHWLVEHHRALEELCQRTKLDVNGAVVGDLSQDNEDLGKIVDLMNRFAALTADLALHANHVLFHHQRLASDDQASREPDGTLQAQHRLQRFAHERLRREHSRLIIEYVSTLPADEIEDTPSGANAG